MNTDIYTALEKAARGCSGDPGALPAAIAGVVSGNPVFGSEAPSIVRSPQRWFNLPRMSDPLFWAGQQALCDYIGAHLTESVGTVVPHLPRNGGDRVHRIVVYPVPGLTECYGAAGGAQLFGLYEGADPREMLLFLSHTYYHEISAVLSTPAAREAETNPVSAERFRKWMLLLIRNEGIANHAVLDVMRRLRAESIGFRYFKYTALVDSTAAAARAMSACRHLLTGLDRETVERVNRRVSKVLKNPRLPVINLIGIQMAEAVARHHGERVLLDVDQREPEEFFVLYARTGDALRDDLFGANGAGASTLLGPAAAQAVGGWQAAAAGVTSAEGAR
jgi:hypothetical protein